MICIIGRGKAGWHCDGTYGDDGRSRFSGSGGTLDSYAKEAPDGTPVYDADEADFDAFSQFVYRGPMVNPWLTAGMVEKFGEDDRKVLLGMLPALQDGFRGLAAATLAGLSSLDYVAVDVYLQALRERCPGVRFGVVRKGANGEARVDWEES